MTPLTKFLGIAILVLFLLAFFGFIIFTIVEHRKAIRETENNE